MPKRKAPPNFTEDARVRPEYRTIFYSHEFPANSQVNAALFIRDRVILNPIDTLLERLRLLLPSRIQKHVYDHISPNAKMMRQLLSSTPNEAAMIRTMSKLAMDVILLSNAIVKENTGVANGATTDFEQTVDIFDRIRIVEWAMKIVDQLKTLHVQYLMAALPFFPTVPKAWTASPYSNYEWLLRSMEEESAAAALILAKMRAVARIAPIEEIDASIATEVLVSWVSGS